MRKGKIIWNSGAKSNASPTLPQTNRGLPTFSAYFNILPKGFTEASYLERMIPGAMFTVSKGSYILSGLWDQTSSDQITYVSRGRYNPNRSMSAISKKVEESLVAIYVGQKRLTEWDGKGWLRVLRPTFIIDGQIVASLDSVSMVPVI